MAGQDASQRKVKKLNVIPGEHAKRAREGDLFDQIASLPLAMLCIASAFAKATAEAMYHPDPPELQRRRAAGNDEVDGAREGIEVP